MHPLLQPSWRFALACYLYMARHSVCILATVSIPRLLHIHSLASRNTRAPLSQGNSLPPTLPRGWCSYWTSGVYQFGLGKLPKLKEECWGICMVTGDWGNLMGIKEAKDSGCVIVWSRIYGSIWGSAGMYLAVDGYRSAGALPNWGHYNTLQ